MGNMLLAMLFLSFSFMAFRFSYAYMGAYRTFYGLFSDELETCVITVSQSGEAVMPYFSLSAVEDYTEAYLEERLAEVCQYKTEIEGYAYRGDYEYPMGVSIRLCCTLLERTLIDRTALFTLMEEII